MASCPPSLTLLSWNIDGLSRNNIRIRTPSILQTIKTERPDIIFLQEVLSGNGKFLQDNLSKKYDCIEGKIINYYYNMTLLKRKRVQYVDHYTIKFSSTKMDRGMLITEATVSGHKIHLLNTHLESLTKNSEERVKQFKVCLNRCIQFSEDDTVIFGGDLGLHNHEVESTRGLKDVWEFCGSRPDLKYTWDMLKNKNINLTSCKPHSKPQFRFDRIYIRLSHERDIVPSDFRLVGQEKIPGTGLYPSDHWGIIAKFCLPNVENAVAVAVSNLTKKPRKQLKALKISGESEGC